MRLIRNPSATFPNPPRVSSSIHPSGPSITRALLLILLSSYPPKNHPEANQSKDSTSIEDILILRSSLFNKSDRISAQSQGISRIQNLSLCILHISTQLTSGTIPLRNSVVQRDYPIRRFLSQ